MKKLIKKLFKLVDEQDFDYAIETLGNAKDREDYEWKLRQKLFRK
jgi:hypothetical protein